MRRIVRIFSNQEDEDLDSYIVNQMNVNKVHSGPDGADIWSSKYSNVHFVKVNIR